jgi:hypothetical protein
MKSVGMEEDDDRHGVCDDGRALTRIGEIVAADDTASWPKKVPNFLLPPKRMSAAFGDNC